MICPYQRRKRFERNMAQAVHHTQSRDHSYVTDQMLYSVVHEMIAKDSIGRYDEKSSNTTYKERHSARCLSEGKYL